MIGNSVEAEDNSRVSGFVCVIQKSQCVFTPGWNIMILLLHTGGIFYLA